MGAGKFDRVVRVLGRQPLGRSAFGEPLESAVVLFEARAAVANLRAEEKFDDPQFRSRRWVRFRFRWRTELQPGRLAVRGEDALDFEGARWRVEGVEAVGRRREILVTASTEPV